MNLPAPPTKSEAEQKDHDFKIIFRVGVVLAVILLVEVITGVWSPLELFLGR